MDEPDRLMNEWGGEGGREREGGGGETNNYILFRASMLTDRRN